jgi:hypothetical protein
MAVRQGLNAQRGRGINTCVSPLHRNFPQEFTRVDGAAVYVLRRPKK